VEGKQKASKEVSKLRSNEDEKEKIIRVADYEVEPEPPKKTVNSPPPSHSREKSGSGSRLLMRRNQGSRLDRSCDSNADKRSMSGRKVK
jgi:hypothetical protein